MFSAIILISYLFNSMNDAEVSESVAAVAVVDEGTLIDEHVRDEVTNYFSDIPELARVAYCESTYRHFGDSGDVLRGIVDSRDVGVMQINEYYHLDSATNLGFDIHTLEGNMGYARHLYEKQGLQPWSASSACWGADAHVASK